MVLPYRGWEAGRYEGDVQGNKAITGWLYGRDVTYGAAPARCEGPLSPAGQCFIALLLQWLWLAEKVRRKMEKLSSSWMRGRGFTYLLQHSCHSSFVSLCVMTIVSWWELFSLLWALPPVREWNRPCQTLVSGTTLCLIRCITSVSLWITLLDLTHLHCQFHVQLLYG